MNFREALAQILQSDNAEFAGNPFWLYSRLSDLCKSYIDRQKISLLFEVDKRLYIVRSIMADRRIAEATLKVAYPAVKNIITAESYKKLIVCVAEAAFLAVEEQPQQVAAKVKVATVQRAEEKNEEEPRTFLYHRPNYVLWWTVGIGIVVLIIAGIVCLCVFGKYINWNVWQHIIGSIGGLILFVALFLLAIILDDELILDFKISEVVMLPIVAVTNFLLFLFLRENYKVLFIWLSAYAMLWGIILAFFSYTDDEEGEAIVFVIETAVILAAMILGLVFL